MIKGIIAYEQAVIEKKSRINTVLQNLRQHSKFNQEFFSVHFLFLHVSFSLSKSISILFASGVGLSVLYMCVLMFIGTQVQRRT